MGILLFNADAMISAPIEQPSLQELQASLAEAWHVEGAYCDSAQAWQQLADLDDYKCEATLKTALAYFSLGIESRGIEWLDRALNEGVPMYRNDQSTSQEQYFASIEHADKDSKAKARAYNGLGVLHWKTGMYTTAREYFDHALVYNPEDPCALINYIGMSLDYDKDIDEIKLAIDQAILSAPHRYEPFVIWSRVLRKLNADQSLINNSLLERTIFSTKSLVNRLLVP